MIPSSELAFFLDDLKAELSIGHTNHDAALIAKLEAAFEVAESVVGHALFPGSVTDEPVYEAPVLEHSPVTAVTSATLDGASVLSWLSWRPSGVVSGVRPGTLVSYSYGQQNPTPAQREAVVLIAAHLWRTRGGVTSTSLQDPEADTTYVPGYGFALPNQARDLLRPPSSTAVVA